MLPIYKTQIISPYGIREHTKRKEPYYGIDFVGTQGASIYSEARGKVMFIERRNGYGNVAEIQHNSKIKTVYAHLRMIKIKSGQIVSRVIYANSVLDLQQKSTYISKSE